MFHQSIFLKNSRIPEPELMEEIDQVEAYANANFKDAHDFIIKNLLNHVPQKFYPKTILDLGAGPGDMTARLVSTFKDAFFTVLDGSERMIIHNKNHLLRTEPKAKIDWEILPIQNFIPEKFYEFIFSNSLLHHLQDPFELWSVIQRSSDENTFIFISDLLRPKTFEEANHLVELYAKDENEILKRDFYNSLLASFTVEEVETMLRVVRLDQKLKVDQISDRHWICYSRLLN